MLRTKPLLLAKRKIIFISKIIAENHDITYEKMYRKKQLKLYIIYAGLWPLIIGDIFRLFYRDYMDNGYEKIGTGRYRSTSLR